MNYRREIDGLRALAIIPVLLFHAGFSFISGGFVGVDVFFVISGFLITGIILSQLENRNFSLVGFYEKRARRILPALFFITAISTIFAWILLSPEDLLSYSKSIVSVALYVSNIFFAFDGGYFETAAELKPLLHTWSLSVEEQYYVFFPLLLILLWKLSRKHIPSLIICIALCSILIADWGIRHYPVLAYFSLPSRAWELAIGAFCAIISTQEKWTIENKNTRQFLGSLGLILILASVFLFDAHTPFPGFYALVPTVGSALVLLYAQNDTFLGKLLSHKFFVGIGLISYSLYLWHQPIFAFYRNYVEQPSTFSMLFLIVLSLILSYCSWKYVEAPFRNTQQFSRRKIFLLGGLSSLFFILFGSYSYYSLKSLPKGRYEYFLANTLTHHSAIYSASMDERLFSKYRIGLVQSPPDIIVTGSSRHMQINQSLVTGKLLNLSVSGASLQDLIALNYIATQRFSTANLFIGVDPWVFNEKSGQIRWKSLENDYANALTLQSDKPVSSASILTPLEYAPQDVPVGRIVSLYEKVNVSKVYSDTISPSLKDKILTDGSRIYNKSFAGKSPTEIARTFEGLKKYSLSPYLPSSELENTFSAFLRQQSAGHKVTLVLSPYHPQLYVQISPLLQQIESSILKIAQLNHVAVLGSFNPLLSGCAANEFYDGMHPKAACMKKVLSTTHIYTTP